MSEPPPSQPLGKDPFSESPPSTRKPEPLHGKRRAQPSMLFIGVLSAALGAALAFVGLWFISSPRISPEAATTTTREFTTTSATAPLVAAEPIGRQPLVAVTSQSGAIGGIALTGGNFAIPATLDAGPFDVMTIDGSTCSADWVATDEISHVTVISCTELDIAPMNPSRLLDTWMATDAFSADQRPIAPLAFDQRFVDNQGNRVYGLIELTDTVPAGSAVVAADGGIVGLVLLDLFRDNSATPGAELSAVPAMLPANLLERIGEDIAANGHVSYGDLGVEVVDWIRPGSLDPEGAQVWSVVDQQSSLRSGDIILSINGQPIGSADSLVSLLRFYRGGDTISITVSRASTETTIEVLLNELSERNP